MPTDRWLKPHSHIWVVWASAYPHEKTRRPVETKPGAICAGRWRNSFVFLRVFDQFFNPAANNADGLLACLAFILPERRASEKP
jgi:hypothetical protein